MVDEQKIQDVLKRVAAGEYSDQDIDALRHAIEKGQITLANGERAVAVGGNLSDVVVITGDRNVIIGGISASTLRTLLSEASGHVSSANYQELERTLQMARRTLAIPEEQAAGFGKLHIPDHLCIELEEKRREVAELEQRLKEYKQVPTYPVVPLGINLPERKLPSHMKLPAGYRYLGRLDGLTADHLYRERDGHVVLWFPASPGVSKPFLIDKYAITARQFSDFLNDLLHQGVARLDHLRGIRCCVDWQNRPLVFDALEYWRRGSTACAPWLHAADPWGMTCVEGLWQPVPGNDLLPATLVTWWGARLYSLWAHHHPPDLADDETTYLPTVQQWQVAALWDAATQRQRRYPWGETWQRERVNYAGYWAKREVLEADWEQLWATQPDVYRQTRPLPVAYLSEGCSPIGCVQMIGNVWEWCADALPVGSSMTKAVKGGACLSPQEHCSPDRQVGWRSEQGNEYIGFRCCFTLVE